MSQRGGMTEGWTPGPPLEHWMTHLDWTRTSWTGHAKEGKRDGEMVGRMPPEEYLRAWDKRNPRMSTNKPVCEGLLCERTISFTPSFPGEQNSDQWAEVTSGCTSAQYNFLTCGHPMTVQPSSEGGPVSQHLHSGERWAGLDISQALHSSELLAHERPVAAPREVLG